MIGRIFGGEGNRGLGLEASWLSPLPWYVELVGSPTDAAGEATARSFYGAEDLGVSSPADLQATVAVKQFFPLSDDLSLAWGLSGAFGPNPTGHRNRTDVYGTDVYLKYRPITYGSHTIVSLQAEWFYRRRQVPDDLLTDSGGYAYAVLALRPALGGGAALRGWQPRPRTRSASDRRRLPRPVLDRHRQRLSAASPSGPPSSRGCGCRARPTGWGGTTRPIGRFFSPLEFVVGAHGAHVF